MYDRYICPYCKARLDPNEKCDCQDEHEMAMRRRTASNRRMAELLEEEEWKQEELKLCC